MGDAKILVVDDEPKILKILERTLQWEGYLVEKAADGVAALEAVDRFKPDLIILDLMMPGMNGFDVCKGVREKVKTPIIILSAKGEEMDKVIGFNLGVDDYVTKPFSPTELVLRVKAVLRRTQDMRTKQEANHEKEKDIITVPGLEINRNTRMVKKEGKEIELTAKEFELLWLLASNPNQVFTREQLLYQIWNTDYYGDSKIVTVLVKRLREKLEENIAQPRIIKTLWGVGYKFGGSKNNKLSLDEIL
ncbi:MAG: response regulator transcription factor [Thermincolia bacterium]